MSDNVGFQITLDTETDGVPARVGIQIHCDHGEDHYYGATFVNVADRGLGGSVRHQLTMTLLGLVAELAKTSDEQWDTIMKVVERPF